MAHDRPASSCCYDGAELICPRLAKCGDCRCSILRRHPWRRMLRGMQPRGKSMRVDLAAARLTMPCVSRELMDSVALPLLNTEHKHVCSRDEIPRGAKVTRGLSSTNKLSDRRYSCPSPREHRLAVTCQPWACLCGWGMRSASHRCATTRCNNGINPPSAAAQPTLSSPWAVHSPMPSTQLAQLITKSS